MFVDASFINASLDPFDPDHETAKVILAQLVYEYEIGTALMFSHGGVASTVPSPQGQLVLEMCDVARPRRDLRRLARKVIANHPHLDLDLDQAMTHVIIRRNRIGEIATFDPEFEALGITTSTIERRAEHSDGFIGDRIVLTTVADRCG